MSRRVFDLFIVFALAVPFGIAMAHLPFPPPLSFALGFGFGTIAYVVADRWWESQH